MRRTRRCRSDAINYGLAEAAPIIVHLAGDESRSGRLRRHCTSIVEVTGLDDGRVTTTELWGLDGAGHLVPRHARVVDAPGPTRPGRLGLEPAWLGARAVAQRGRSLTMVVFVALIGGLAGFGVVYAITAWSPGRRPRHRTDRLERHRSTRRCRRAGRDVWRSVLTGWVVAALAGAIGGYVATRAFTASPNESQSRAGADHGAGVLVRAAP